jgi:hypothetical protein
MPGEGRETSSLPQGGFIEPETTVLLLLIIFLVVFLILAIILGAATLGVQGYLYSEPVADIVWRAPAAGAGIAVFLLGWAFLDYGTLKAEQADLPFDTLFRFNPTETRELDKFWSIRSSSFDAPPEQEKRILYTRQTGSAGEYVNPQGRRWERVDGDGVMRALVIVDDQGQEMRLEPELKKVKDPNNPGAEIKVWKTSKEAFPGYANGRRKMPQLGVLSVFRWGLFLGNLFLNALFLGVCFVCLWLILRFQWTHALGLAVVLWLTLSLAVVPMLLAKTQDVARQRAASQPATAGANKEQVLLPRTNA